MKSVQENNIPTAILLIGYDHQDPKQAANFQQLAEHLADQLRQVVIPCPLDRGGNPLLDGIRIGLQQGVVKFVVQPLFISPAEYQANAVVEAITWASRRWSFLSFHVAPPLNFWTWANIFAAAVQADPPDPKRTGVVLVSHSDSDTNSQVEIEGDLAKLGRILHSQYGFARVEQIHIDKPSTEDSRAALDLAIRHCQLANAQEIVLLPISLFGGQSFAALVDNGSHAAGRSEVELKIAAPVTQHPPFITALVEQYQAGLADDSLLPVSWDEVRRQVEASYADHGPPSIGGQVAAPADEVQFQNLTERINQILPPRYQQTSQGEAAVSAAPMASADLQFDDDGNVAWDQMWGLDDPDSPFCELALAGGPAHRGDLLEPVAADECRSAPGRYAAVLAEMQRGIKLVSGLKTVNSSSLGWIGVQCADEEMAIWLLRAIIVENVMVRREGNVLYLPAGPSFALAGEIKNVVTVVAKTVHYWKEHSLAMSMRKQRA